MDEFKLISGLIYLILAVLVVGTLVGIRDELKSIDESMKCVATDVHNDHLYNK